MKLMKGTEEWSERQEENQGRRWSTALAGESPGVRSVDSRQSLKILTVRGGIQLVRKRKKMEEGKLNGRVETELSISLRTCPLLGVAGSSSHSFHMFWVYSGEIGDAGTSAIRSDWQETSGILKCMKVKQTLYLRKRQLGKKKPNK